MATLTELSSNLSSLVNQNNNLSKIMAIQEAENELRELKIAALNDQLGEARYFSIDLYFEYIRECLNTHPNKSSKDKSFLFNYPAPQDCDSTEFAAKLRVISYDSTLNDISSLKEYYDVCKFIAKAFTSDTCYLLYCEEINDLLFKDYSPDSYEEIILPKGSSIKFIPGTKANSYDEQIFRRAIRLCTDAAIAANYPVKLNLKL